MSARSFALLALLAPLALARCKPPSQSAAPPARPTVATVVTGDAAAPTTAPTPDAALAIAAPPADSPESDDPYALVVSPSGLLREAIRRAHDRLRVDGPRFRVRAIYSPSDDERQELIDLTALAAHADDESLRERCAIEPAEDEQLSIPARNAALRAFVLATPAARRTRSSDPSAFAELQRTFSEGPFELTVGCTTRLGNALVITTVDDQHIVVLRKTRASASAITATWLAATTGIEGPYHVEDDRFRADFTGDSVNEAAFIVREYEGPRWRVELFSADAQRPAVIDLPAQSCDAADCDGETGQLHCREGSRPSVLALWDTDRWILRVGVDVRRMDNGALAAGRPRDPALAAWLDRARSQERSLRALARALSYPVEQRDAHRTEVANALRALGEEQLDVDRALANLASPTTR